MPRVGMLFALTVLIADVILLMLGRIAPVEAYLIAGLALAQLL